MLARCCKGIVVWVVSEVLLRRIVVAAIGPPVTDTNPFIKGFTCLGIYVACEFTLPLTSRAGEAAGPALIVIGLQLKLKVAHGAMLWRQTF